jgi:hypothetical protein
MISVSSQEIGNVTQTLWKFLSVWIAPEAPESEAVIP